VPRAPSPPRTPWSSAATCTRSSAAATTTSGSATTTAPGGPTQGREWTYSLGFQLAGTSRDTEGESRIALWGYGYPEWQSYFTDGLVWINSSYDGGQNWHGWRRASGSAASTTATPAVNSAFAEFTLTIRWNGARSTLHPNNALVGKKFG